MNKRKKEKAFQSLTNWKLRLNTIKKWSIWSSSFTAINWTTFRKFEHVVSKNLSGLCLIFDEHLEESLFTNWGFFDKLRIQWTTIMQYSIDPYLPYFFVYFVVCVIRISSWHDTYAHVFTICLLSQTKKSLKMTKSRDLSASRKRVSWGGRGTPREIIAYRESPPNDV